MHASGLGIITDVNQRVLVAMSGGVDSSVAALLLLRAGYEVVGMTAELYGAESAAGPCCGLEGIPSARGVCDVLGIAHHTVDLTAQFERQVIERFIGGYRAGITPNPCADCNRFIKFELFFDTARELDCELIATGHHARILPQSGSGRQPLLAVATDRGKDQTYFLACIGPERLERVRFPVGEYTKPQVRALAAEAGLPSARRSESQDVCFLANSVGIRELMLWHTGGEPRSGEIVDEQGRVLGEHPGIEHFTIGQRKGLGLGGGSEGLVVHRLLADSNMVVVAQQDAHPVACIQLVEFIDLAPGRWESGGTYAVRARYNQQPWPAQVQVNGNEVAVLPETEQYNLAAGQWLVGYRDDIVLFAGIMQGLDYR